MPSTLLDALRSRVLVLDGAMGTSLHSHDLDIETDYCGCENCPEILLTSRPELVREIHESFLKAGADAVETDSFGGAAHVLREFDLQDRVHELNRLAASVAREACDKHATPDQPRFVLGSIGPGTKLITLGQIDWPTMLESYRAQASGLIEGGADALLLETCQDILQVRCAVNACVDALAESGRTPDDIPIMVSLTIETTGTMLMGTSIEAAVSALARFPIALLGLNCATGPTEMAEHLRYISRFWPGMLSVAPNAGLPVLVEGRTEYPLAPGPFAEQTLRFVSDLGINLVGGCCGTTPEHIAKLREGVDELNSASAESKTTQIKVRETLPLPPASTSLYAPVEHRQDNSILIVGERMNASGSRAFKRLLEAEDWDGIVALAKQQMREGSHLLDLNVDYAGRDNASDMEQIVARIVRQVDAPLMLDSTQAKTIEAGLRKAPGKCIINSANFEDGDEKFDLIAGLASRYGAALVIGTIDEDKEAAMARTRQRKLDIATRAIERASTRHAIPVSDIFIDPLVLPVSTGMDADRRSALELIEGTRLIAERFPEVQITCGLSNCSFGLKPAARAVLNSVLLDELVKAGLTSAIVHASKIIPLARIPEQQARVALHLIYDRRDTSAGGTGLPQPETTETVGV